MDPIDKKAGVISVYVDKYIKQYEKEPLSLEKNKMLFKIIEKGEDWISEMKYYISIMKWCNENNKSPKDTNNYINLKEENKKWEYLYYYNFYTKSGHVIKPRIEAAIKEAKSFFYEEIVDFVVHNRCIRKLIKDKIDEIDKETIIANLETKGFSAEYFKKEKLVFVSEEESKIGSIYFNESTGGGLNTLYKDACRIRLMHHYGPSVEYYPYVRYISIGPIKEIYYNKNREKIASHTSRGNARFFETTSFNQKYFNNILQAAYAAQNLIEDGTLDPYTANVIFVYLLNELKISIKMNDPLKLY